MGVEGVPERDVVVTFTSHFASYNPGERACFHDHEAQELVDRGVASPPGPTPAVLTGNVIANPGAVLTALQAQNAASFAITVSGTVVQMGPVDLTGASDMAVIAAAFGNNITGAGCTWHDNQFFIETDARGAAATLTTASTPISGTDVSNICRLTTSQGATVRQGTG